jgi:hypothetical protein
MERRLCNMNLEECVRKYFYFKALFQSLEELRKNMKKSHSE